MQQMIWSTQQLKQCEKETGQAMLLDEHTLVSYSQDFGKLIQSKPAAICIPQKKEKIQAILNYANQNKLPVTLRGKGLSQSGQALSVSGGLMMHLEKLNKVLNKEDDAIWVEANSSWSQLLEASLQSGKIPYVVPFNCNLSIAGLISAAGIGSSSFKFGPACSKVKALEVILANGELLQIDKKSPLFNACLGGQGRFAVITKACIQLRSAMKQVRTFFLVYLDKDQWLNEMVILRDKADYLETFCSPSLQGSKLVSEKRIPFSQWLFATHVSVEYDQKAPEFIDLFKDLTPWKIIHQQDESLHSYLHRHSSRFEMMKQLGLWDLAHPWYECFMSKSVFSATLDELLEKLPSYYAPMVHVVPIKPNQESGFFMLPAEQELFALMILNPGVNSLLIPNCLETMKGMDETFLKRGGKRYLSGYLGSNLDSNYWQDHFGNKYEKWIDLKKKYDPHQILQSQLFQ